MEAYHKRSDYRLTTAASLTPWDAPRSRCEMRGGAFCLSQVADLL